MRHMKHIGILLLLAIGPCIAQAAEERQQTEAEEREQSEAEERSTGDADSRDTGEARERGERGPEQRPPRRPPPDSDAGQEGGVPTPPAN